MNINNVSLKDNKQFVEILNEYISIVHRRHRECSDCKIECVYGEIADHLLVSIQTIKRWTIGKHLPRKNTRKTVISYIKRRMNKYENRQRKNRDV